MATLFSARNCRQLKAAAIMRPSCRGCGFVRSLCFCGFALKLWFLNFATSRTEIVREPLVLHGVLVVAMLAVTEKWVRDRVGLEHNQLRKCLCVDVCVFTKTKNAASGEYYFFLLPLPFPPHLLTWDLLLNATRRQRAVPYTAWCTGRESHTPWWSSAELCTVTTA